MEYLHKCNIKIRVFRSSGDRPLPAGPTDRQKLLLWGLKQHCSFFINPCKIIPVNKKTKTKHKSQTEPTLILSEETDDEDE